MKKYELYILSKVLKVFVSIVFVLIAIIWFSRSITFIEYATVNKLDFLQAVKLFLLILPWLLVFLIPIALLIAIIIIYSRLITYKEITILKNCGLDKFAMARSVILLSIILSFINLLIVFYFIPFSNQQIKLTKVDIYKNYINLAFVPKAFKKIKNFTIYIEDQLQDDSYKNIIIHDRKSSEFSITITARVGRFKIDKNNIMIILSNGSLQRLNHATKKIDFLDFDEYVFNLTDEPKEEDNIDWKPKEMYLKDLLMSIKNNKDNKKFKIEMHKRINRAILSTLFASIALAVILSGAYSRYGNRKNIILTIIISCIYFILSVILLRLSEKYSLIYLYAMHLNSMLFFIFSIFILKANYRIIK